MTAMAKKLTLETKIRDASASLAKVNVANKSVSKQSTDHLENANRKVENVQKELWKLSERWNEVNKKLLEHRAGVLSCSFKHLQRRLGGDVTGISQSTSSRSTQMSPSLSEASQSSSVHTKFDGLHFFAGHESAITPTAPRKQPSSSEYTQLEQRLKEVTSQLEAATEAQAEMKRVNGSRNNL